MKAFLKNLKLILRNLLRKLSYLIGKEGFTVKNATTNFKSGFLAYHVTRRALRGGHYSNKLEPN